jgi:predicted nucleic acid-binding protein
VLVPDDTDWLAAGELAGRAARAVAGGGAKISTAFDRVELISDALTAILAARAGFTIVTEDADYELLSRFLPGL